MIDCHAHMGCEEFFDTLDEKVKDAKAAGVRGIIVVPEYFSGFQERLIA